MSNEALITSRYSSLVGQSEVMAGYESLAILAAGSVIADAIDRLTDALRPPTPPATAASAETKPSASIHIPKNHVDAHDQDADENIVTFTRQRKSNAVQRSITSRRFVG